MRRYANLGIALDQRHVPADVGRRAGMSDALPRRCVVSHIDHASGVVTFSDGQYVTCAPGQLQPGMFDVGDSVVLERPEEHGRWCHELKASGFMDERGRFIVTHREGVALDEPVVV